MKLLAFICLVAISTYFADANCPETQDLKEQIKRMRELLNLMTNEVCSVGMADGRIKVGQLSASSTHPHPLHELDFARLNSQTGRSWLAGHHTHTMTGSWFQVDLLKDTRLSAIATQGAIDTDQWVTTYKVTYKCASCSTFIPVKFIGVTYYNHIVFGGNSDRHTVVRNHFPAPISARYVRIYPLTWHNHASIRMELYTC